MYGLCLYVWVSYKYEGIGQISGGKAYSKLNPKYEKVYVNPLYIAAWKRIWKSRMEPRMEI